MKILLSKSVEPAIVGRAILNSRIIEGGKSAAPPSELSALGS
jgi:hypothetical protein